MRYMSMVKMAEDIGPAPQELFEAMGRDMAAAFADGSVLDAGGLCGMKEAVEITLRDGTVTTVDGPYTEAKEVAGGYAIIDVRSHDEAVEAARRVIELHKQHWPGWEGSVELRRISDPEMPPGA